MEPQRVGKNKVPAESVHCVNKPKFTVGTVSFLLKIDKSYKTLRYSNTKLSEGATGSDKTSNLQSVPESNAKVFQVYESDCHKSELFNTKDGISFQVYMFVRDNGNSSGQRKGKVYLDVRKPKDILVLVYAAARPTSTGPFVEKPDDKQFWNLACQSDEYNRILMDGIDLESVEDELRLTLDVTYAKITQKCEILMQPQITHETDKKSSFISSIGSLLDNPMNCDVTLRANDREWPVHKCILSARSPVFAAMFNGKLKESTANSVEIKQVNSDAFDLMIKYIYKNELEGMQNLEVDLLCLADRYDLPDLKKDCEVEMIKTLSLENCLSVYLTGLKFFAELVVAEAESFILENFSHVCTTREWAQFAKKNSTLSVGLTVSYSRTVNSN